MDYTNSTIKLYTMQSPVVVESLERDGACFSRKEYVTHKYAEVAPIFNTAYSWFVKELENFIPKPAEAEYPYWAFTDLSNLDKSGGGILLELAVPLDDVVLFNMFDWYRILCLKYLGENSEDEARFQHMLAECGLQENQIMLTSFYPQWKAQIFDSWGKLFRHHQQLKLGDYKDVPAIQAGLWQIKKDWIVTSSRI